MFHFDRSTLGLSATLELISSRVKCEGSSASEQHGLRTNNFCGRFVF